VIFPLVLIFFIAGMQMVINNLLPETSQKFFIPPEAQIYPQAFGYTAEL
jgi:hypothetical protein